mgnify:FL=1
MKGVGRWVVDASVVLARLLQEERPDWVDDYVDGLHLGPVELIAPPLLWLEIGNRLVGAKSVGDESALEAMLRAERLGVEEVPIDRPVRRRALTLARTHGLSMYDAVYLATAAATGTRVLTLDARLERASYLMGLGREGGHGRILEPGAPYGDLPEDETSLAAIGQALAEMRREYSS